MGQIERLPPPGLSARYVIRQETSAGAHGKGRNAPKAALPVNPRAGHSGRIGSLADKRTPPRA